MNGIHHADPVLPGTPLDETIAFFRELGFRLDAVQPADAPRLASMSGFGTRFVLDTHCRRDDGSLRIVCDDPSALHGRRAPNGIRIDAFAAPSSATPAVPADAAAIVQCASDGDWHTGRAGMLYRDLVPHRMGGHLIASHIRIPDGGPVPDDVHFHEVRFQLIFCVRGSVRLVYQDQGEPFELGAGSYVLQPPGIRHRVLSCTDGLEVVELACPAEHPTRFDHELSLPNGPAAPGRDYGGQRFTVQHADNAGANAPTVAAATDGLADVDVAVGAAAVHARRTDDRLAFAFVLAGSVQLLLDGDAPRSLATADAVCIPPGLAHALHSPSDDCRLLRVWLRQDSRDD